MSEYAAHPPPLNLDASRIFPGTAVALLSHLPEIIRQNGILMAWIKLA